ncbi:Pyruvate, phosphate dikinase [Azospirillaceae bacterium]
MSSQPNTQKWVYPFGENNTAGHAGMKDLLGGKGANLAEMSRLGLPVPPGFTITTEVCTWFYANNRRYPSGLEEQVAAALAEIEKSVGMTFGAPDNPLLVSVRSGGRASMPGMMDTVLNLGLNDETVDGLARRSGDPRFAFDSYRRFIQMYSNVVLGVDHYLFEDIIHNHKSCRELTLDTELSGEDWRIIVQEYKTMIERETTSPFPQDVRQQLWGAIGAVFGSWMNSRAITYRRLHDIPHDWGTAVNVQAMVFGNMGEDCATGVAFTRNPSTGENVFYGEYLANAQGEDVVAGLRTPQHLTICGKLANHSTLPAIEESMPEIFEQLLAVRKHLESHYHDMQDIEFTVQKGRLYMLQTRSGKRTAMAALRIAVDMVGEGLISEAQAVRRIDPNALEQLLHPTLDPSVERHIIARGLPASPGAASGKAVFTAEEAVALSQIGESVILVRPETSPEDIHGMHAAKGVLTSRGGMTSHAAVVARGMGRPCVAGVGEMRIDLKKQVFCAGGVVVRSGDVITIDGGAGEVILGSVPTIQPHMSGDFSRLMAWADQFRRMKVRANAETAMDAETARHFGAEGIGLCRTEHMFFESDRIIAMRQMIMADNQSGRRAALAEIEPMQRGDFVQLFRIMKGLPVTIRLLDPPLHEFLPHTEQEIAEVARVFGAEPLRLRQRVNELQETNPMLGHRGCRLGITYPEIYEMQTRAIFHAAIEVSRELGQEIVPEIMIPLVGHRKEFEILKRKIDQTAVEVARETGVTLPYKVGVMIELPRAALRAQEIAETAEFFSFGTITVR